MKIKYWFMVIVFFGAALSAEGQSLPTRDSAEARELWELAIAAKGGREALYKIQSLAEIRENGGKNVTFIILPDKYFTWFDARPGQFGLDIKLYNYETGFGYRNSGNAGRKIYQDIRTHPDFKFVKGRLPEFMYKQLFWLLETRWMQPKPIAALKDNVGGKRVDRVDVLIEGYGSPTRFAVYLDEKTHLPVRIAMCRDVNTEEITDFCCFSNKRAYVEMDGVKIPTESSGKNTSWGRDHIELNPAYDPQFFDRPPDHNAGGLQWRKAGAKLISPPMASQPEPLTSAQIAQFIKDLDSPDEELRQTSLRELVTAGKQVIPALTDTLTSSRNNPLRQYNIAVVLLKLDDQSKVATAALADSVTEQRLLPQARQDAAFGLLRNKQGILDLIRLLQHPDVYVRRYAVFAFDELTERVKVPSEAENARPILNKLMNDEDQLVRQMAKEVLVQMNRR